MGITRSGIYKRTLTGRKRHVHQKKRKFYVGRPPANTKLVAGERRIRTVRTRGGNQKRRALRLDSGVFSWPSECMARVTRILDVVYSPANSEMVRTKTLVKGNIVAIDATPFRNWYYRHYGVNLVASESKSADTSAKGKKGDKKSKKESKADEKAKGGKKTSEKKGKKEDSKKESKEPKKDSKKDTKDSKKEAKDTKKESKKEGKKESKKEGKKESKKEGKKESKDGKKASKDAKKSFKSSKKGSKEGKKTVPRTNRFGKKFGAGRRDFKGKIFTGYFGTVQKQFPPAKPVPRLRAMKWRKREAQRTLDANVQAQFETGLGRLYACVASRPGQVGKADGYILEGAELEFYLKKMEKKKKKKKQ